jgi:D-amino peptidase
MRAKRSRRVRSARIADHCLHTPGENVMRSSIRMILLATLLAMAVSRAQAAKLKVYVSADMEGVGGVSSLDVQARFTGREYEQFRRLFTLEVNAAIQGAFDAGATEVLVSDSHGDGENLDVELLDGRVQLVSGSQRPLGMVQGIDSTFDAVVFVGYHAGEGQADAVIPHAFGHDQVEKLNGIDVDEAGFNAAIAGHFGVPVVFLSGDQTIAKQATERLGPIETAVTKQAIGYEAATMLSPEKVRLLIRAGVKRGIERRADLRPYRLKEPVRLQATFYSVRRVELLSYLPGVQRVNGNTVEFTARDMVEASKFLAVANSLPH